MLFHIIFVIVHVLFCDKCHLVLFDRELLLQGSQYYGCAWKIYIGVSVCAWIASAVFHSHDTAWTEKLDYMAAFATVVTGAAVCVIRCFGILRYSS